jgi:ketosteroid isomerase-like protein
VPGPIHGAVKSGTTQGSTDLRALDREFSKLSEVQGTVSALTKWAAPDVRWNREGLMPAVGLASARTAAADSGTVRLNPEGAGAATSSDLGYTYGIGEKFSAGKSNAPPDSFVYVHVWRRDRDGAWKLALGAVKPL